MYKVLSLSKQVRVFIFCILFNIVVSLNDIKGLDDSLLFRINWPGNEKSLLESPFYEKLEMTTTNNELFHCLIPIDYGELQDSSDAYTGPNALNLLMPLFKKPVCTLRLEAYWTYELCHGLHIKQFHEDRDGNKARFQEYTLGVSTLTDLEKEANKLDEILLENRNVDVPQTIIEGVSMPYFPVIYEGGTPCDLTGNSRISKVIYVCFDEGRHAVYSIKETFTCEYEIVILTPLLCKHPSYRPHEVPQTDMHCIPADGIHKRPRNLLHFEAESIMLRNQGAMFSNDGSDGLVHIKVDNERAEEIEAAEPMAESVQVEKVAPFPPQPSVNKKLMEDFLNGDYCLDGGAGWWQYEFCYGKTVHQYHRNRDGSKLIIHLGSFDIEKHRDWVKENPHKAYKEGRKQVSHFYSGGDFCTSNGKPRQVEVKLKCRQEASKSDNAVTLYLLEPKVCEYVLGVETALVCSLMDHTDSLGLFTLPTSKVNKKVGIDELLETVGDTTGWRPIAQGTVESVPINEDPDNLGDHGVVNEKQVYRESEFVIPKEMLDKLLEDLLEEDLQEEPQAEERSDKNEEEESVEGR